MTCYLNFEDSALGLSVHAYKRRTQRGIQQQHSAHLCKRPLNTPYEFIL
ncbi:hypothetical protein ACG90B_20565 [Acinetobacter baumannii]